MDDQISQNLQNRYLAGDRSALSLLYSECRYLASLICKDLAKKKSLTLPAYQKDEIAHDAASRLVERLMRNHGYKVHNFRSMLYFEVLHAMTGNNGNGRPVEVELPEDYSAAQPAQSPGNPKDYLRELLDAHPRGMRVVYDLSRARYFGEAVRRIAAYTSRPWVRTRVAKMYMVYNTLRVKA